MHYQEHPYQETKLVRCTRGSVYEVMIDLRKDSKTFKQWDAVELCADQHKMLYIPEGMALGFQTLEDNTEVFYQMSQFYKPEYSKGLKYDDPSLKILWPLRITVVSQKDKSWKFIDEKLSS